MPAFSFFFLHRIKRNDCSINDKKPNVITKFSLDDMEETYKTEITKNKTVYAIMKYTFPHLLAPKTHRVSK